MIIGIAGHDPFKLGWSDIPNPVYDYIMKETRIIFEHIKPERVILGMDLGYDQYVAELCIEMGIPFIAVLSSKSFNIQYNRTQSIKTDALLKKAEYIVKAARGRFHFKKYKQKQAEWIVDNCDVLLCCWNGCEGYTYSRMLYAKKIYRPMIRIDPRLYNKQTSDPKTESKIVPESSAIPG